MRALRGLLSNIGVVLVAGAVGFAGVYAFSGDEPLVGPVLAQAEALISSDCNIKGNVSIGSGERIYHVPGQRYYNETVIRPEFGERWFCSEADARAAGWRRSGV